MSSGSFSERCMQPARGSVVKSVVEVKNNHLRYVSRLEKSGDMTCSSLFRSAWSLWCSICRASKGLEKYLGRKRGSISIPDVCFPFPVQSFHLPLLLFMIHDLEQLQSSFLRNLGQLP